MIFKQSAIPAILFFKMRSKFFIGKTFGGQNFPWVVLLSEALGPIIRDVEGHFSMMTTFDLEAGVKNQIQHLEKILHKIVHLYDLMSVIIRINKKFKSQTI